MTRDLVRAMGEARASEARHRRLVDEAKRVRRQRPEDLSKELARLLDQVADRITLSGTASERFVLHSMADAARLVAPGATSALVDWEASETLRLRAFGIVYGLIMGVLGPQDRAWLLDRLRRGSAQQPANRVA